MNLLKRQNTLDKIIQYKIQIVIEILFGNIRYFFMLIFFYKVQVCHQTCRREPSSRSASHKINQFVPSYWRCQQPVPIFSLRNLIGFTGHNPWIDAPCIHVSNKNYNYLGGGSVVKT